MPNLLILGGTSEANALARAVAEARIPATYSYAGRVDTPRPQPVPVRTGGFGGTEGLIRYLKAERITHVIDATHPFAAQMSRNAAAACAATGIALIALTRAPWAAQPGDRWNDVPDIAAAVRALGAAPARVFLAIGRMHLAEFAAAPQHAYLLRLVDAPTAPLPLPDCTVEVARGPFDTAADTALLRAHRTEIVVSKNSGGAGAYAKITAARALGLPVVMIGRPALPARAEVHDPAAVLDWLAHPATPRGE